MRILNVIKKDINFSIDTKIIQFDNLPKLDSENICTIKNEGMLLSKMYLYLELPQIISIDNNETWKGYVNGVGFSIIKNISFYIGGFLLDSIDGNYLDIYNELYNRNTDELVNKLYNLCRR